MSVMLAEEAVSDITYIADRQADVLGARKAELERLVASKEATEAQKEHLRGLTVALSGY